MNDLISIQKWLDNPDRKFSDGISLYDKYKPSNMFDEYFRVQLNNPDEAAKNILIHRLNHVAHLISSNPKFFEKKLIAISTSRKPVTTVKTPSVSKKAPIIDRTEKINIKDLPANLQKDYKRIQEIMPLLGGLHAKMRATHDNVDAKNIITEISALDQEKRKLWQNIDKHMGKTDASLDIKPPTKKKNEVTDPLTLKKNKIQYLRDTMNKRIKTLATQKKHKPHLAKKTAVVIEKYRLEIATLEKEIADIK